LIDKKRQTPREETDAGPNRVILITKPTIRDACLRELIVKIQ
jgi:hypothetical protein